LVDVPDLIEKPPALTEAMEKRLNLGKTPGKTIALTALKEVRCLPHCIFAIRALMFNPISLEHGYN
jgi:hypothetical protein